MPEFKTVLRSNTFEDKEYLPVYITVSHKGKTQYIKTQYKVGSKGTKKSVNRKGNICLEVTDKFILKSCGILIDKYTSKCHMVRISTMNSKEIAEYLKKEDEDISFISFADKYITAMVNQGRVKPSRNYRCAVNSLCAFMGNPAKIQFNEVTSQKINSWIKSLSNTSTAKKAYPSAIKSIFSEALKEYNDYDNDIIKIKNDPFRRVKIPRVDTPNKRSIDAKHLNKFFNATVVEKTIYNKREYLSRQKLSQDVAKMIICLAGINAVDLYLLEKENYIDGKLCYQRKKTKDKRADSAYIEITVPEIIKPLFKDYKGKRNNLLSFRERYSTPDDFCRYINKGMGAVCEESDLPHITTYCLRHSWATIARNYCNATTEEVAFALNHQSAHKVTEGYILKDYSPIDKLNNKVIDFIFNTDPDEKRVPE